MSQLRADRGSSLVELLFGLTAFGLILTLGALALHPASQRRGVEGAAQQLAAQMRELATAALSDGASRGLVFPLATAGDEPLQLVRDGDQDGIARSDISRNVDRTEQRYTLARDIPGCRVGRPAGLSVYDLPPSRRRLTPADPAVRFGSARMAVFTSAGEATPGSLFVSCGDALCAVVVNGATARIRVYCWAREQDAWVRR